ncbi:glycine receptor subunit alphaZ1-like [Centruroides sculpturatus]|uniref:glycine receptor subunit alphaZ1-like n=1 Tax=Centruroides sculpturatus TaxID=218467 RepID=UPI000C6ED45A|nr:glycine receptor subunit alphaZ1-like [Centruroides sculpturatus]
MLTLRPLVLAVCLQFSMLNANFGKNIHNIYQATLADDSDLQVLDTLLENYDRRITPNHHLKKPTKVLCEMYIRSLGAVSPATMDFEVDLYLRQTWTDNRMRSPNLTRPLDLNDPNLVKKVWRPDVYFPNAKYGEFQYVTVPNVLVRINPDGKILYMLRLMQELMLDGDSHSEGEKVEVDKQCLHGPTDFEVDLYLRQTWTDNRMRSPNLTRPLDLNDPNLVKKVWRPDVYFPNAKYGEFQYVTVPNIYLRQTWTDNRMRSPNLTRPLDLNDPNLVKKVWRPDVYFPNAKYGEFQYVTVPNVLVRINPDGKILYLIGEYSCLRAEFDLKRSIGHHLVQSYLPTILIVVISWVSFWLDVDAIPARITLGVTTLLTISSESSDQQANLAPVSYVKALDVWMGTCTMFVFAALLEFTFVNYLARKKIPGQQTTTTDNNDKKNVVVLMTPKSSDAQASIKDTELPLLTSSMFTPRAKAKKIDQISRVAFPIGFVVFNALYWPYYLT